MSNRRSRRLNAQLKTDVPTGAAKVSTATPSNAASLEYNPEALLAPEKPTLEHYKVEDRIQSGDALLPNETEESGHASVEIKKPRAEKNTAKIFYAVGGSSDAVVGSKATQKPVENNYNADPLSAGTEKLGANAPKEATTTEEMQNGRESSATEAELVAVHPIRRHRTRSTSSAASEKKEIASSKIKVDGGAATDDPASIDPVKASKLADAHATRRHRTRSTSSAVSSISGESQGADTTNFFDNDGKTPLIANRRPKRSNNAQSQGPVRKRHKGRSLFVGDAVIPIASTEPSLFQDGVLNTESEENILAALPRSRSNTVDSFRAAMDSTLNIELSESVVLPEMKTNGLPESSKTRLRSDTIDFMSKCDFLASPRGRSDTIDLLTDAMGGDDIDDDEFAAPLRPTTTEKDTTAVDAHKEKGRGEIAFGKTPKKNNLTGDQVKRRDPIKKRYRSRSLSYTDPGSVGDSSGQLETKRHEELDEDDIATASIGCGVRSRSNTLESFQNAVLSGRSRSDTMDFLAAAVAGDMGHDLDAAIAAATAADSSFAMHPISAPSGASTTYHPATRSRSNTLDSAASSVDSSKLDFLISMAVEEGGVFGLLPEERIRERTESTSENSSEHIQRRSRSNTLEMYSSMAAGRGRSDTIDFLVGGGNDQPIGNLDDVALPDDNTANGCVLDHLKALCSEPAVISTKTTGILRRGRLSSGAGEAAHLNTVTSSRAKFDEGSTKRTRANSDHSNPSNSAGSSSQRLVMEALKHFENDKRDRNDSWGGMSDLSVTGIAATHDALKSTGIIDDLMAAAADIADDIIDDFSEEPPVQSERKRTGSGGTNSLSGKGRPRLDSLASLSLASLSDASISVSGRKEQYASELAHASEIAQKLPATESKSSTTTPQSIVVDYDAIASAVDAAAGLDLNSILPSAAKPSTSTGKLNTSRPLASEKPAVAPRKTSLLAKQTPSTGDKKMAHKQTSLPPAATKPTIIKSATPAPKLLTQPTPKSALVTKPLPPKYQAAPKPLTNASASKPLVKRSLPLRPGLLPTQKLSKSSAMRPLPLKPLPPVPLSIDIPIPKSTKTEAEMEAIRERARAAAGYVPPPGSFVPNIAKMPPGKLPALHRHIPLPPGHPNMPLKKRTNAIYPPFVPSIPPLPGYMPPQSAAPRPSSLQSQQKWEDMFDILVKFIEETREEQTRDMSEEEKSSWVWDVSEVFRLCLALITY